MKSRNTVLILSICILITVMISACSSIDFGEEYTLVEYKSEDNSDYIVIKDSEGNQYSSAHMSSEWLPSGEENEKVGFCRINEDKISVYAYKGDAKRTMLLLQNGWNSNTRPCGVLYRTDIDFPIFSEDNIDGIRYVDANGNYEDSLKKGSIVDADIIKKVMSVLRNESMYMQLDTTISHPTGGYTYSEERLGTVYFYSNAVPFMVIAKQVISYNGEEFYLIRREGKSYICAPVQDTLDMIIAATPE